MVPSNLSHSVKLQLDFRIQERAGEGKKKPSREILGGLSLPLSEPSL